MLHSKFSRAAVLGCALVLSASGAHAASNLVINGSFESGAFQDNTGQDTHNMTAGATVMDNWTVIGEGQLSWSGPSNPFGQTASQGDYALDLTGFTDSGAFFTGVTQTIATVAGGHYRFSFDLGSELTYGVPVGILASAGAASQDFTSSLTNGAANIWATKTFDFTAGAGHSTVIALQGSRGSQYVGLDNVSVTLLDLPSSPSAAPEPASWALMILGFGGMGALLRDRRRRLAHSLAA